MKDTENLDHTVRSLRVMRGLTVAELAKTAGISSNTVARIERGVPGRETKTAAVARALGVSLEVLHAAMDRSREEAA